MSLADQVLAGEPRAIARALSLIENDAPEAAALVARLRARRGGAIRIGLTGPPGAGKSTLADRLVSAYRARGSRVAVLAIDPSSPFTRGAILGDRVRMQAHARDAGVFIRSMATRGQLGGLARATDGAADVLDAAGFDVICIETVGVGQAEVDLVRTADVIVVIVAPGAGDEIQALKAGVLETGDIFVVNKADLDGANRAAAAIQGMLSLESPSDNAWRPRVVRTVATTGDGVASLVEAIEQLRAQGGSELGDRRRARAAALDATAGTQLDHVGIAVTDASNLSVLLHALFGLDTGAPEMLGSHRLRFVDSGPATLELVEALSPEAPIAKFLASRGTALHHLCLRVPDIDATLARLKSLGIRLLDEQPRPGAHGSRIAFLHPASTEGILIEIKEGSSQKSEARGQKPGAAGL